ncbi:MAG TPA: substrate-binding domain-containing protein [Flavobacterium sp.]|nr:substrate-binding domain-containing protein [Flavobacterium sp.]HPJ10172.1 substrate-binding domain-containing protein [Flavobacterium sp.]
MRRYTKMILFIASTFLVITCKDTTASKRDTMTEGSTTFLVDETLTPIIESQIQIFEDRYTAKILIQPKSETEVIQALVKDSARIAILSRSLTKNELSIFENKKIIPRITPFAEDAIAVIGHKGNNDTLIALQDVIAILQGKETKFKGLVFDNPNSSTARLLCELAGIKNLPEKNIYSFKTNNEVIKYIAENDGLIGVVGVNYIYDPTASMEPYLDKVNVLSVKANDGKYYSPTQNDIAEGKYPLARRLYSVNCQGYSGLGMGFAAFVTGEVGQRIILKSGLVPIRVPSRKIVVRNAIENKKNN